MKGPEPCATTPPRPRGHPTDVVEQVVSHPSDPPDASPAPAQEAGQLALARRIEDGVGVLRSARGHLTDGPFRRSRRRARRQLRRMGELLARVQLAALAGELDPVLTTLAGDVLDEIVPAVEHVLYHEPAKARLQELRALLKQRRRTLQATLSERGATLAA